MKFNNLISTTALLCSASFIISCSSGTDSASTTTSISGSIFASAVNGASVTIKDVNGNTVAGPVSTATDGTYSINIPDSTLTSDLVFESTGGIFDDEATGAAGIGTQAGTMSAYLEGGSLTAGDSVHVTPGTTIVSNLRTQHGKNSTEATNAFFNAFAYNTDTSVQPVAITDKTSTADDDSRHIGWRAAVFSQLAQDLGLNAADQFDMFVALAQDLSDGSLDGIDASGAVSIGSTGSTLPTDILDKYNAATGSFTTANTANYQVTYTPPMMNVHGKNKFTISVADSSGTPVSGLTNLSVMPKMYMANWVHATPMGEIIESSGQPGDYEVTIYYLMPSRMMDGTTMGTWDLKVMIGTESVHFYPNINMAMMTNTTLVRLRGVTDTIIDMNGLEVGRTYNLFKDGLKTTSSGSGTHDFDIFIAPIETMMSFPALVDGMTLQSGMGGTPYDVSGITVEAEVNGSGGYTTVTNNNDGSWSLDGITLKPGPNTIKVKLLVSGEQKTTDGKADDDTNDFATFTVTLP